MSDEESFVVLGTSPFSSINNEFPSDNWKINKSNTDNVLSNSNSEKSYTISTQNSDLKTEIKDALASNAEASIVDKDNVSTENQPILADNMENEEKSSVKSTKSKLSGGSLAASFIMGEIDADLLKTSVYSQFPSLCSIEACPEDAMKLQNFMGEYIDLKNTLVKVNATMKAYYNKTHHNEQQYKRKLEECENQIIALRSEQKGLMENLNGRDKQIKELLELISNLKLTSNGNTSLGKDFKVLQKQCDDRVKEYRNLLVTMRNENLDLKHNLEARLENMTLTEEQRRTEFIKMNQDISEKTSIINNMRAQIELLEQQQLKSFEFIKSSKLNDKPEYVEHDEHVRIVKEFERKMSSLLAENLEAKDMQKQYIDEINCLKVNQVSAEEYIKTLKHDVEVLKSQDVHKADVLEKDEEERQKMRDEMSLLRHQIEVYRFDFEIEKNARESIVNEKQQLLQELRLLQRKNQELISSAQKQWELYNSRTSISATGTNRDFAPPPQGTPIEHPCHICPICARKFTKLHELETHVDNCLDNNS